jgi:hypothetical protein
MNLPGLGIEVNLPQIKEICDHFHLSDLWKKIEKDPPKKPFSSDGCSLWFNKWKEFDFYPACFKHDLKYWCGHPGEDVERLIADAELMIEIARITKSTHMAEVMFAGVRIGGGEWTKASFSWGFGRSE